MSYQLELAARELIDWIHNHVGDTDDWPAAICFDDEETARQFCQLLNRLEEILDDL